jgi:hypothetical protein
MSKRKHSREVIEYIEWEDHVSLAESGWKSRDDAHGLTAEVCKSVGFILRENAKEIVLVSSLAGHQVDGEVCIIKKTIVRRERLNRERPK